jgi:hypothetical protein
MHNSEEKGEKKQRRGKRLVIIPFKHEWAMT